MNLKSGIKRTSLLLFLTICHIAARGQQSPLSTLSYYIFTPDLYNPAMTGSKDFFSLGINASFKGESNTQLISGNTRLTKSRPGYFSSPQIVEFSNIGVGGSVFRDVDGLAKNTGISGSFAYHIPLNRQKLSFLSFGAAIKETYSQISTDTAGLINSDRKQYYPNGDLGIYFYSPSFFAGASAVNILGSPWIPDTSGNYQVPVWRQYFFNTGFKIVLSKAMNIVLEPSVLISATDSTFDKISDNISPIIKLYLENFCFGTSVSSGDKISFFAQFRYPSFYVGAYYELTNNTAYYKNKPVVEFTLGLNIMSDKSRIKKSSHW